MDENKEQSGFANKVEQIDLGPFRHMIHYRDPKKDWDWTYVEADRYLPTEILNLHKGINPKYSDYFKNMFAEWGEKLDYFVRNDGVRIGYIKQTHRRWTILGDLRSVTGYYHRRIKRPAVDSQKEMWEIWENTDAPHEP